MIKDKTGSDNVVNRKKAPRIKDAVEFDLTLKPYEKYVLDNGVEVYAVNTGAEEVMMVEWVFSAGNWYEEQNGIAAATSYLIKNGTKHRNAFEISEHVDFYGAYVSRNCFNETATITLHTLTRHLPELLPVVAEMVNQSVFPEQELDIFKQNNKQRLEVNLKKCDFVANRKIDEYLYGIEHPYGKYAVRETYDRMERGAIADFHHRYYQHGKCIIFVAGVLPGDIVEQLNRHFGQLPLHSRAPEKVEHPVLPSAEKRYRISNDPDGVQGAIRMARPFMNRKHPDFPAAQVLNTIFGGFFGSRLMSNIREDKGYTYGIHSYFQSHLHASSWMISTEAGRDVCEATVAEVYREMKALREKKVTEDELMLVKNYLIGSILGDLDGPFHIMGRWKNVILNDLPDDYFYTSVNAIKNVRPEKLQELAEQWLREEDFYELVVV